MGQKSCPVYFLFLIFLCPSFASDCGEDNRNCGSGETIPVQKIHAAPSWLAADASSTQNNQEKGITDLTKSAEWETPSGDKVVIDMGKDNGTDKSASRKTRDQDADGVNFYLHTKKYPSGMTIKPEDETSLEKFMPGKETKFICHGFWSDITTEGTLGPVLKAAYLETQIEDANLILIDWRKPASTILYRKAVVYTKTVAKRVSYLIETLVRKKFITPKKIHFIGHSLGAHIGGLVNNYLKTYNISRIGRISGLDPAGPRFEWRGSSEGLNCDLVPPEERLSLDDADFVDIVHTDLSKWGMKCPIGDVDYYPNGGRRQPGCFLASPTCSHSMSYQYFSESIRNPFSFFGCPCEHNDIKKCECKQNDRVVMGAFAKKRTVTNPGPKMGVVYLSTRAKEPYGCGRSFSCNSCDKVREQLKVKTESKNEVATQKSLSEMPWIVTLSHPLGEGDSTSFCSGVLLEPNVILTAAHCVNGTRAEDIVVTAGRRVLGKITGDEQHRSVWFWQMHPFFYKNRHGNWYNDVALIYTQTPFDLGPWVGLATLNYDRNFITNSSLIVAEFEKNDRKLRSLQNPESSVTSVLKKFDVNLDNCKKTENPGWLCASAPPHNLQLGFENNDEQNNLECGTGAGAPLVSRDGRVVGTVSTGSPQCNSPTVFMSLERYQDWIENGRRLCVDKVL